MLKRPALIEGISEANPSRELERRKELADFIRTRREKLKPALDKVSPMIRRRTPGLRREEVAELAGVGATWYTWLEQSRDIHPSTEVLERVGKALSLNPFEMRHLFTLAGKVYQGAEVPTNETVPAALKRFVDESLDIPALVVGERKDHLYWNEHFTTQVRNALCGQSDGRNYLEMLFLDPAAREFLVNWESHAKRMIAEFRAGIGDKIGTPWVSELIERLKSQSSEFALWWKDHDVSDRSVFTYEINHPKLGRLAFERTVYSPAEAPELKLVLFKPIR
jgi:transcriptional regulator with XRE-family HTH domain